jgi:hypothetical protein
MQIVVEKYPQLRILCWNRAKDAVITGEEAFALYERNWRFVDESTLEEDERRLLAILTARYGNDAFMGA